MTYTAYESLKQKGIDLIENKALKKEITTLYERQFTFLVEDWDATEWRDNQVVVTPYFAAHFYYDVDPNSPQTTRRGRAYPNDYSNLIRDPKFKNVLTLLIQNRGYSESKGW